MGEEAPSSKDDSRPFLSSLRGEEFRVDGRSARLLLSPYELRELTSLDDRQCFVAPLVTFGLIAVFVTLGLLALYSEAWFLLIVALLAIATHQVDEKVSLAEKRRLRDEG